jgi:N-acetylmuramoyl-L-alanine amidase
MRKLYIFAGHNIDPRTGLGTGAHANGYDEAKLAIELRDNVVKVIHSKNSSIPIWTDDNYSSTKTNLNKILPFIKTKDILIEFHWNAFTNSSATGLEAYIPDNYTKDELYLASDIISGLSKITGLSLRGSTEGIRGVKRESQSQHPKLQIMRPNCINILIEMGFITNINDIIAYLTNKDKIIDFLADTLINAVSK